MEYEYVQVQVYLKLMGLKEAKLIEQFNSETDTKEIKFDSQFFDYQKLVIKQYAHESLQNEKLAYKYLVVLYILVDVRLRR